MHELGLGGAQIHTFINPYSYRLLRGLIRTDDMYSLFQYHMDGISLAVIDSILHFRNTPRRSFDDTSLAPEVFNYAKKNNLSIGLVGSSDESIKGAMSIISEKYKPSRIVAHHGFFSESETSRVVDEFSGFDIVICSMGTPRQEHFLLSLVKSGWTGVGFTCGGYFDQLNSAGGLDYYPALVNKLNLRWAYRIYREPKRLWKRYLIDYPVGCALYIYDGLMFSRDMNLSGIKN